uniref:Ig-like domain-containing protein n=1 Tax=Aquila chrysaetos chrysaetos TaxID=223781 RepID=A0A663EKG8_AQUCH
MAAGARCSPHTHTEPPSVGTTARSRPLTAASATRTACPPPLGPGHGGLAGLCLLHGPPGSCAHPVRTAPEKGRHKTRLFAYSGSSKQVERVARRAEMVLEEILKGNASLALGDAEVREEGTYSCLVSVASLTGEQSIQLQIEGNREQHKLVCNIRHYYPHNTQAQWLQEPKDTWKVPDVMKNVLSGGDQQSSNGTYSSSRCFLLTASLKDGGHKYTCWVDHPSLQSPIRRSMTVEVRDTAAVVTYLHRPAAAPPQPRRVPRRHPLLPPQR